MATLADVIRRRRKTGQSRTVSLAGSLKDKLKEKIDPRQLFNQSGILTSLFPSLKAYKAKGISEETGKLIQKKTADLSAAPQLQSSYDLSGIEKNTQIAAVNSLSLPGLSRDVNVMRQNIIKLVKVVGLKPENKADNFFKKSKEREAEYESKFKTVKKVTRQTPEPTTDKEENSKSFLAKLIGIVGAIIKSVISTITKLLGTLTSVMTSLVTDLIKGLKGAIVAVITSMGVLLKDVLKKVIKAFTKVFSMLNKGGLLRLISSVLLSTAGTAVIVAALAAGGLYQLAQDYRKGRENTDRARYLQEQARTVGLTPDEQKEYEGLVDKGTFVSEGQSRERALKSQIDKYTAESILNGLDSSDKDVKSEAQKTLNELGITPIALRIYYEMMYGEKSNTQTRRGMTLGQASNVAGERQQLVLENKAMTEPTPEPVAEEPTTKAEIQKSSIFNNIQPLFQPKVENSAQLDSSIFNPTGTNIIGATYSLKDSVRRNPMIDATMIDLPSETMSGNGGGPVRATLPDVMNPYYPTLTQ